MFPQKLADLLKGSDNCRFCKGRKHVENMAALKEVCPECGGTGKRSIEPVFDEPVNFYDESFVEKPEYIDFPVILDSESGEPLKVKEGDAFDVFDASRVGYGQFKDGKIEITMPKKRAGRPKKVKE